MSQGALSSRALVIGDVMTDIICRPEGPLVRGSDRRAGILSRPGGSGANQAVWLGAMGVSVAFAARVGIADKARLEAHFREFGVEPLLTADAALPSGVLVTIVDPDGERSFLTDRGANTALSPADLPDALLDGTRLVMVSGYSYFVEGPRAAVMGFCLRARERTVATAVDPASVGFIEDVGADNFLRWTAGADLILANQSEAMALTGAAGLDAQMRRLSEFYTRVVIKCGAAGAVLGDRSGIRFSLRAPKVTALDTTGAGDAFAAGFIAGELLGAGPEECLRRGIAAGSDAVKFIGGQPARP